MSDCWGEMYNLLVQFKQREGHSNVPYRHKEDGDNLGYWLSGQREARKKGSLKADSEQRLSNVGVSLD